MVVVERKIQFCISFLNLYSNTQVNNFKIVYIYSWYWKDWIFENMQCGVWTWQQLSVPPKTWQQLSVPPKTWQQLSVAAQNMTTVVCGAQNMTTVVCGSPKHDNSCLWQPKAFIEPVLNCLAIPQIMSFIILYLLKTYILMSLVNNKERIRFIPPNFKFV